MTYRGESTWPPKRPNWIVGPDVRPNELGPFDDPMDAGDVEPDDREYWVNGPTEGPEA